MSRDAVASTPSSIYLLRALVSALVMLGFSPGIQAQGDPQLADKPVSVESVPTKANEQVPLTQEIRLLVKAKGNGNSVRRVEARLPGGKKIYGDKDGLLKLPPSAAILKIELYKSGFEVLTLELAPGQSEQTVYLMPAAPSDSNEIVIRGEKPTEASRKTVTTEEAIRVAPGRDPAQIPRLLPGVQVNNFRTDIVIRGSPPNGSLYVIDDFQVPFIFHSFGNISVIPDQIVNDVAFSTGGFGPERGNVTGGVVNLRTKNEVPERSKTEFRVNIPIYSTIYHEQPVNDGKDYVAVSARRSYLDLLLPPILKKAGNMELTVFPLFGDEHIFYVHPIENGVVKVIGAHVYDGVKLILNSDLSTTADGKAKFDIQRSFELLGVEWKKELNQDWNVKVEPSLNHQTNSIDIVNNNIDIGLTSVAVYAEAARKLNGKDRIYVGTELSYGKANVKVLAPEQNPSDPFYNPQSAPQKKVEQVSPFIGEAVWVGGELNAGDLLVMPGLRGFRYSQLKAPGVDPRVNWRFQINNAYSFKGAVGQYSQTPEFSETSASFGNPNLNYIESRHYVLGLETVWSDLWISDVQGFYKTIKKTVQSDPIVKLDNDGDSFSTGMEFFVRRNLTERLFGWLAYTYSINRAREQQTQLYHNSQYDQSHVLNITGSYKYSALWTFGGRGLFRSGNTYNGVDYSVYNVNLNRYEPRQNFGTQLYNRREPAYYELNLYADREVLFDTWKLTWRFGVENLALKPQVQGVNYNYDYSKQEFVRSVPPVPYIEVRGIL